MKKLLVYGLTAIIVSILALIVAGVLGVLFPVHNLPKL